MRVELFDGEKGAALRARDFDAAMSNSDGA
jgi:hypothetical protein